MTRRSKDSSTKVQNLCHWICYQQRLHRGRHHGLRHEHIDRFWRYVSICFWVFWVYPWMVCTLVYIAVVIVCGSCSTTKPRPGFCIEPLLKPDFTITWYLDLWTKHTEYPDHLEPLSPSVGRILTSHLVVCDAEIALRKRIVEGKASEQEAVATTALEQPTLAEAKMVDKEHHTGWITYTV